MTFSVGRAVQIGVLTMLVASAIAFFFIHGGKAQSAQSAQSAVSPVILEQFSIPTSNAATSADALPSSAGIVAENSRSIVTGDPSLKQWIAARGEQVCVVVSETLSNGFEDNGAFACSPPSSLAWIDKELLVMSPAANIHSESAPAGPRQYVGLAPNGITAVTVTYGDKTSATVPVVGNGFHFVSSSRPVVYSWAASDGTSHVDDLTKTA